MADTRREKLLEYLRWHHVGGKTSDAADKIESLYAPAPNSSTWGNLSVSIQKRIGLQPHEWDNMNSSEQRDFLLTKMAAPAPAESEAELKD